MRNVFIAAIAAQLALSPAVAADVADHPAPIAQDAGAFVGARVRVALGGGEDRGRLRAGIVAAPTLRTQAADGRVATRFGEGLELGLRVDRAPALSIAGRPLTGLDGERPRAGVSTLGWVAIGTAVVLAAGAIWFVDAMNDASE